MTERDLADMTGILGLLFWTAQVIVYVYGIVFGGSSRPSKEVNYDISHETMRRHMELVRKLEETFARQQQQEAAAQQACLARQERHQSWPNSRRVGAVVVSPSQSGNAAKEDDNQGSLVSLPPAYRSSSDHRDKRPTMRQGSVVAALAAVSRPVAVASPVFFDAIDKEAAYPNESLHAVAAECCRANSPTNKGRRTKRQLPASETVEDEVVEPPNKKLCTNQQ